MGINQHHSRYPNGHGVDGEVPTNQIVIEIVAKFDSGLTRLSVITIGAVGRDFNGVLAKLGGDCPKCPSHIPGGLCQWGDELFNLVGRGRGREVEIIHRATKKGIPDRSADQRKLESCLIKCLGDALHRFRRSEILQSVESLGNACHRAQSLDSERVSRRE